MVRPRTPKEKCIATEKAIRLNYIGIRPENPYYEQVKQQVEKEMEKSAQKTCEQRYPTPLPFHPPPISTSIPASIPVILSPEAKKRMVKFEKCVTEEMETLSRKEGKIVSKSKAEAVQECSKQCDWCHRRYQ